MENVKIKDILYILRTEKGIKQEKLCLGLCSKGTYSNYENGERMPDRLTLNALLQRLGKDSDKMATILTSEEYEYFHWKRKVLQAVGQEDMSRLQQLLEEPEAIRIVINESLQKQFLYQMQGLVSRQKGEEPENYICLLEQAVELTMPKLRFPELGQRLIGVEEMRILLNLSEFLIKGGREEEALQLLVEITKYVDRHHDDYEIKVKIFPKAVRLAAPLMLARHQELEGLILCKKAVELLCWQGILFDLAELMEYYLKCAKGLPETNEKIRYEKQLQALREVYEEYGAENYRNGKNLLFYSNQEMYLLDEVIKRSRMDKNISQEQLSEGICTPETLSRIESGRRAPNTKNFRALMDRLEVEQDYYNPQLDTNNFLLLEKQQMLDRVISLNRWEEARQLVDELKAALDMSRPLNRQTIEASENCILFQEKKLTADEFLHRCEQVLGCEGETWRQEKFWNQFFTKYKIITMNHIALLYARKNKREDAIFILEHLLQQLSGSKVRLSDRYKSSVTVISNLSSYYGSSGRLKECLKMCEIGIRLCLESGRGMRMGGFIGNKAEAMNDMVGKYTQESEKYLKQTYYISDLISDQSVLSYTDKYYRSHYEEDIKWY